MTISPCVAEDVDQIIKLYEFARQLQRERKMVAWPSFDKEFLGNEILEQRQWKLVIDNQIVCNWTITYTDKEIWEDKDNDDAIYIHRITTHKDFRGQRFIDNIVKWARGYVLVKGRQYIRLDTLGNNAKLIQHYTSAGFDFLGIHYLTNTEKLPLHYQNEPNCCLFEISLHDT
jgi:GNAT superfamily N-acetyltransferase